MLKPINAEIDFEYKCEQCGGKSNWMTQTEAVQSDFKFECYCGYVNTVIPIKHIKITYNCFDNKKILDKEMVQKAVKILRGIGYLKSTAEIMILKVVQAKPTMTTDEIVKQALKREI